MTQWKTYIQPPRQGTSHKKQGNKPCQDMGVVQENNNLIVGVLADGLGQLKYSEYAASTVTTEISKYLLEYDYSRSNIEILKKDILVEIKNSLEICSSLKNISITEMDCTLLFVVVFKKSSKAIYGQLGDGAICLLKSDRAFQVSTVNDKYKVSSNVVKTVLSKDALEHFSIKCITIEEFVGFILTTDGLENEIYSKVGKVKKTVEWYFNLISNNKNAVCVNEVKKRWDELTVDEKYGFTDDMSLIAIVKENQTIELPDEATWLCICGNRNRLESTRCEKCSKDFLKIYKGINFKENGGNKKSFFMRINDYPDEELRVIKEHCIYVLESDNKQNNTLLNDEVTDLSQKHFGNSKVNEEKNKIKIKKFREYSMSDNVEKKESEKNIPVQNLLVQEKKKPNNNVTKEESSKIISKDIKNNKNENNKQSIKKAQKFNAYNKKSDKNKKIINIIVCLVIGFIIINASYFGYTKISKKISEKSDEISKLEKSNKILANENKTLKKSNNTLKNINITQLNMIESLNVKVETLEKSDKKISIVPKEYDFYALVNSDAYIGNINDNEPHGIGVIYSVDKLMVGNFIDGMKEGEFYVLFDNGNTQMRTYQNDKLISINSSRTEIPFSKLDFEGGDLQKEAENKENP